MAELVWILDSRKGPFFGNKGISSNYIIPQNDLRIDLGLLAGNILWIVLRGTEDRLFKVIKIKKVERILEGYHSGDFLVSVELTESIKLVSDYSAAAKFKLDNLQHLNAGVSEIEAKASEVYRLLVKNAIQIKLTSIPEKLLASVDLQPLPRNRTQLAKIAIRAITSTFTLDQVWTSGSGDKLRTFANFAYAVISRKKGVLHAQELSKELQSLDPTFSLFKHTDDKERVRSPMDKLKAPSVDSEFTEIDPANVFAREFLSIDSKLKDLEEALNKTEHAEKIHQEMLRDISTFLISRGIVPYESGSIDLMYSLENTLNVFEIKSTNTDNILAQSAKGAFQLSCYQNELSKDYDQLNAKLIIHKTESDEIEAYAMSALHRLGIITLIYDPAKSWPNRVIGLFPR